MQGNEPLLLVYGCLMWWFFDLGVVYVELALLLCWVLEGWLLLIVAFDILLLRQYLRLLQLFYPLLELSEPTQYFLLEHPLILILREKLLTRKSIYFLTLLNQFLCLTFLKHNISLVTLLLYLYFVTRYLLRLFMIVLGLLCSLYLVCLVVLLFWWCECEDVLEGKLLGCLLFYAFFLAQSFLSQLLNWILFFVTLDNFVS